MHNGKAGPGSDLSRIDYMIVGRIMAYVGGEYSFIKHTWITKIFVGIDLFAILTQAGGGAMLVRYRSSLSTCPNSRYTQANAGGDPKKLNTAKNILLIGLVIQIVAFCFFCFVAIRYNLRTRREPALAPYQKEMKGLKRLWMAFYVTGLLITGRSIYRLAGRSLCLKVQCPNSHSRRIRPSVFRYWVE